MNALFDRKAKYKRRLLWRICGLREIGLAQAATRVISVIDMLAGSRANQD
jgi:hypothetical protein